MKKLLICATVASLSFPVLAADATIKLSSTELKAMDCATLSVEKADAKRALDGADKNIANINARAQDPSAKVSKWAGIASGAMGAFGKGDSRANQVATALAGPEDTSDANNLEAQQKVKSISQTNMENIAVYQKSKKCKI